MATITRIVQQKDKTRANVFLDGKFAFGLSLEMVLKHHLKVGEELSLQTVQLLKDWASREKVYLAAIEFGTRRPRSEKEYKLWFKRKKVEEILQGETLKKLTNLGLVNDLTFARWWVQQRSEFRPKSRRALKMELWQKGISQETIDEVLASAQTPSEEEQAFRIAKKRLLRLKNLETREQKRKLAEYLARKGFNWDNIKEVISKLVK